MWVEVETRHFCIGDIVRVRDDAYKGACGNLHNGRVCVVTAVRSGDVVVDTADSREKLHGVHHPPYKLEKKVEI